GAHRAYIEKLHERGQLMCGGPFLDNEGGGLAIVRAGSRQEASALLANDPAIKDGVFVGVVRRWHALFDEAEDLRAARSEADLNKQVVETLFAAVERRDKSVADAYAKNVRIHEAHSLPYGGEYDGPEGALRHGMGFRATWDRFQPRDA